MLPDLHSHDRILEDLELRVRLVPLPLLRLIALELQAGELEKCWQILLNLNHLECPPLHKNSVIILPITNEMPNAVKLRASLVVSVHRVDGPREVARVELDGRVLLRGEL